MADNVYLLETRLSAPQQVALQAVRDVAREQGMTVFLVGGAVRDLMSGSPVRDLDFAIQGNALKLRKGLEARGARYSGEVTSRRSLFMRFPSGVRVEVGQTLSVEYPKPGKPVWTPVTILEDLRRRDFTANAMALSLNEGSYGLLMDPLNGVADIENRELRLVSNYGFIEDPVRMIRAARLMARQAWQLEERTRARYETGKEENYIKAIQPVEQNYELEEIFHEEDPLRVMRRLEEEGWLSHLSRTLSVARANVAELGRLRETQMQLQTHGIQADAAAANFPLLTAKLSAAEVEAIKASFPRAGFVEEIATLESAAKEFGAKLLSKEYAAPSKAYRFLLESHPATVLWAAYSSRSAALQARFKSFYTEWPLAFGKIPYAQMAEMRITPDLPEYGGMLEKLVAAMMDGEVSTPEEIRAFLEPYSPPAPPPPVSLRRARSTRKESKGTKSRKKAAVAETADETEAVSAGVQSAAAEAAPADASGAGASGAAKKAEPAKEAASASKKQAPAKSATVQAAPAKAVVVAQKATPAKQPAGQPVAAAGSAKSAASTKAASIAGAKAAAKAGAAAKKRPEPARAAVPAKTVAKGKAPVKAAKVPAKRSAVKGGPGRTPPAKKAGAKVAAGKAVGKKVAAGAKTSAAKGGSAKSASRRPAPSAKRAAIVAKATAKKTAGGAAAKRSASSPGKGTAKKAGGRPAPKRRR